jgi:3-oxoacyl-(acyl-carrier-protein) synthase
MKRRVVITGLGPVTPVGIGKDAFWRNSIEGISGVKALETLVASGRIDPAIDYKKFKSQVCAPILNFNARQFIPEKVIRKTDIISQYALAATQLALQDGGFALVERSLEDKKEVGYIVGGVNPERTGVLFGTGIGGLSTTCEQLGNHLKGREVHPYSVAMLMPNAAGDNIAIFYGLNGVNSTFPSACSSAVKAIGESYKKIRQGEIDVAITGGMEAALDKYLFGFASFDRAGTLSTLNEPPEKASRPFDKERNGFVMGEGGGILILEELGHALERGANIYAEVVGYSSNCDGHNIMQIDPKLNQLERLLREAIDQNDIERESIEYANAHGTSTKLNDPNETELLKRFFGEHAYKLKVVSSKSRYGHLIGGAGGAEVIETALILSEGEIPPTINLENPDMDYTIKVDGIEYHRPCDLDYVPNQAIKHPIGSALKTSFGFGGHNDALVLKRYN